ncbi:MAG: PilZ domain-containing protein [Candidatus Omnitrophota bacterium]
MYNNSDKRHSPRIDFRLPLRCQIRGKSEISGLLTKNICIEGISFNSDSFIAPNTCLNLEIALLNRRINTTGQVVRVNHIPRSDKFDMGIKFVELSSEQKKLLSDYINMRRQSL